MGWILLAASVCIVAVGMLLDRRPRRCPGCRQRGLRETASLLGCGPSGSHVHREYRCAHCGARARSEDRKPPHLIQDGEALEADDTTAHLLVTKLVGEALALRPFLDDHVAFNNELLPHVFFGDVTRFVVSGFAEHPERRADTEKILVVLEEAMGSPDEDVQNLVSVSFCEKLLGGMGPRLRAELAKYEQR
jgi:hypothetical protein